MSDDENSTVYNFTMRAGEERDATLLEPASGTLAKAVELAKAFDAVILLTDAAGFPRGHVERNGDWELT